MCVQVERTRKMKLSATR